MYISLTSLSRIYDQLPALLQFLFLMKMLLLVSYFVFCYVLACLSVGMCRCLWRQKSSEAYMGRVKDDCELTYMGAIEETLVLV